MKTNMSAQSHNIFEIKVLRRALTDPRYLRIGIKKRQSQQATIFHNFYFSSVFRLFQFLELLELCKQPMLMDCLLLQRDISKDASLKCLLESNMTLAEA